MDLSALASILGPELAEALRKRGFTSLTPVQEALLDPELEGRDLRISSQTGSGKTVAIGFALRSFVRAPVEPRAHDRATPRALVIVPTRELAKQVDEELSWLYASMGVRVVSVTGGSPYREEIRLLRAGPTLIIGTPGRLLDHLNRKSIDPSHVAAVVLDEADRMLDLGFREDLEAILATTPPLHRTHLVSATFPRDVEALANRVQTDPASVEGTPLGTANADIDHVVHLVHPRERVDAIVNLLLAQPGAQTLIFTRTRAEVADITKRLGEAGFRVSSLSGEMEQAARNRALAAFKHGSLDALVATDVAARGIDVQDIARVIHVEPPTDADSYTHRSGRTGRAGRKGMSLVLVAPSGLPRTAMLLKRAGVRHKVLPIPTADAIKTSRSERLFAELTGDLESEEIDPGVRELAERILAGVEPMRALTRLLKRAQGSDAGQPRNLTPIEPPSARGAYQERPSREARPSQSRGAHDDRPQEPRHRKEEPTRTARPGAGARAAGDAGAGDWVSFRVSWGTMQGADARRLLAMVCRRGGIRGSDVGAIRVAPNYSVVDVAKAVAESFEQASREPDPRDSKVSIRRWEDRAAPRGAAEPRLVPRPATVAPRHHGWASPKRPHAPHAAKEGKAESHGSAKPKRASHPAPRPSRPSHESKKRHRPG